MSNLIFPQLPGLDWNLSKTPTWSTKVQKSVSGVEARLAYFSEPLYTFSLPYEYLRSLGVFGELQTIVGFINQMRGSFDSFLYRDPRDGTVVDQLIGTGDGTTTDFQLVRTYGGSTQVIYEPDASTLTFAGSMWNRSDYQTPMWHANGSTPEWTATDPGAFTYLGNGKVRFSMPPPNGQPIYWSGDFYFRCRFLNDGYEFVEFARGYHKLAKLDFVGSLSGKV